MPADFGTDLRLARLYFRRVCTVSVTVDSVTTRELSLERLRAYSEQVMGCAMEEVLVLSSSFEGGSAQGQAKFDKRAAAIALGGAGWAVVAAEQMQARIAAMRDRKSVV